MLQLLCSVLCAIQYAWPTTVLSDLPVLLVLLVWSVHALLQLGQFQHRRLAKLLSMPVPGQMQCKHSVRRCGMTPVEAN